MRDPESSSRGAESRLDAAIVMLSISMLMFEILQTITLSIQTLERNAFLVVSLCLLGLGIGGSFTSLYCQRRGHENSRFLWWSALLFALTLVLTSMISSWTNQLPTLVLLGFVPYVFVGTFLAYLFRSRPQRINRSYMLNLLGSGLGCVLLIGVLGLVGSAGLALLSIGGLALVATTLLGRDLSRRHTLAPLALLSGLVLLAPLHAWMYGFVPPREKGLGELLRNPDIDCEIEWSRWGYLGRLDIVKPGAGIEHFTYGGGHLKRMLDAGCHVRFLFAAGGNWTKAIDFRGAPDFAEQFSTGSRNALPYIVSQRPSVLNIGFGGGVDIFLALRHGARAVVGVDINPLMIEAGRTQLEGYFDDFYRDPRVEIFELDGRTFARNTDRGFDVITITAVDTGAALHSNAHVLSENYLYTLEAFREYLRLLSDTGVLYVARPLKQIRRVIATAVNALRLTGAARPEEHLIVASGDDWWSALVSRHPFLREQVDAVLAEYGEQVTFAPRYMREDSPFRGMMTAVAADRFDEFLASAGSDFSPVTDDRPFFYEYSRDFLDSEAARLLLELLAWISLVALLLVILPLLLMRRGGRPSGRGVLPILCYFSSIGAGFMFVEVGMIQKLVLYLGHPSYSVSVTLFTILTFSGIGSMVSGRLKLRPAVLGLVWLPIVAASIFYALGLGVALPLLPSDSLLLRIVTVCLMLAPGSFFMGMPFPLMMRGLREDQKDWIPFAWAVNAFASVVTSVLTVLIAMQLGFTGVMMIGTACYLVAGATFLVHLRKGAGLAAIA